MRKGEKATTDVTKLTRLNGKTMKKTLRLVKRTRDEWMSKLKNWTNKVRSTLAKPRLNSMKISLKLAPKSRRNKNCK